MNVPQSTYSRNFTNAFAGQIGDSGYSRVAQFVTDAAQSAGLVVSQGATKGQTVKALAGASEKLEGIVLNTYARNPGDAAVTLSGTNILPAGASANVLQEGAAWVVTEETLAPGDKLRVRHTANGGNTVLGAFLKDGSDDSNARTLAARVLQGCTGAGVALVFYSLAADRLTGG